MVLAQGGPKMAGVEFTAQVKDGSTIEIPDAYKGKVQGAVKVTAEVTENDGDKDDANYLACLRAHPLPWKGPFLSRNECHER